MVDHNCYSFISDFYPSGLDSKEFSYGLSHLMLLVCGLILVILKLNL
jgi:hypothetical protein